MSGNGIRCLAQAWSAPSRRPEPATSRSPPTPASGSCDFGPGDGPDTIVASVAMGDGPSHRAAGRLGGDSAAIRCARSPTSASATRTPSSPSTTSTPSTSSPSARLVPDVNLEIVEPGPEPARRHACGSTSAAPASPRRAAPVRAPRPGPRRLGTGRRRTAGEITVHMDGGDAKVRSGSPRPTREASSSSARAT